MENEVYSSRSTLCSLNLDVFECSFATPLHTQLLLINLVDFWSEPTQKISNAKLNILKSATCTVTKEGFESLPTIYLYERRPKSYILKSYSPELCDTRYVGRKWLLLSSGHSHWSCIWQRIKNGPQNATCSVLKM